MFLSEFSTNQQRAFLVLARQVIAADERLAMQELERLEALYHETGLPPETAEAPDAVGDLNLLFDTPRLRVVVVQELLLLALADGVFDDRENETIGTIAQRMGMETDTVTRLYDWARRYVALVHEGRSFGK